MVRDHVFAMPLDWHDSSSTETIDVFVRELRSSSNGLSMEELNQTPVQSSGSAVMYLQGGPGFPSPRPTAPLSGWMKAAVAKGYRVLLLDQRGTGNSTAMTTQMLSHFAERGGLELQLKNLVNMRSDAIAADIDAIRIALCGNSGKISLLGQSFGGFCILSYMSFFPGNIERCLFTCGLSPITRTIHEVYIATYRRMLTRNRRFYRRYPEDIAKVKAIVSHLHSVPTPVVLPNGGHLTVRRFLQLGLMLGSASGMETMHWLLDTPFFESTKDGDQGSGILSEAFLHSVQDNQSCFESNPIYWLLHESIYMNGDGTTSQWAAESVLQIKEFSESFDPIRSLQNDDSYVNFTGEMVYSWMADDYARLRPYKALADALAGQIWTRPLYKLETLRGLAASIPCAALVSYDDVYVVSVRKRHSCSAVRMHASCGCRMNFSTVGSVIIQ